MESSFHLLSLRSLSYTFRILSITEPVERIKKRAVRI